MNSKQRKRQRLIDELRSELSAPRILAKEEPKTNAYTMGVVDGARMVQQGMGNISRPIGAKEYRPHPESLPQKRTRHNEYGIVKVDHQFHKQLRHMEDQDYAMGVREGVRLQRLNKSAIELEQVPVPNVPYAPIAAGVNHDAEERRKQQHNQRERAGHDVPASLSVELARVREKIMAQA